MQVALFETDPFSPSYITARQRFREVAVAARARIHTFQIGESAPTGEPLSIEVARVGAREPAHVLLVTSGLHGVEGFFGSAVQLAWLAHEAKTWIDLPSIVLKRFTVSKLFTDCSRSRDKKDAAEAPRPARAGILEA